ncbi:MAG: hypothetical protein FJZ00_03070, partial [Candidatus Sericytochromatia bacterium]|nr:hypothetical protein [Candidatus Tanganyikabacteria bacterium]
MLFNVAASTKVLTGAKVLKFTASADPAITAAAKGVPLPASTGQVKEAGASGYKGKVTVDRSDVLSNSNPQHVVDDAHAMLALNAGLEAKALAKLSPADQARYRNVMAKLGDKAIARAVLQDWLIQQALGGHGALPATGDLKGLMAFGGRSLTGNLLNQLDALANQPLAAAIDQASLLSETIREVANPSTQHQESRNSCAMTTACIKLCLENPGEYVRLVAGVASPGGSVKLKNGGTIRRVSDWQLEDGGRSTTGKLLCPALMTYANPGYSNSKDKAKYLGAFEYDGTGPGNWKRATEAILGRGVDETIITFANHEEILGELAKQANSGKSVPVSFNSKHVCLVTGVSGDRVHLINPHGEFISISKKDFCKQVDAVLFERGSLPGQIFNDTNPGRALGNGIANADVGLQQLNPIKIVGGMVQAIGGGVIGGVVAGAGKYTEKGGDWVLGQSKKLWNKGVLGKIAAVPVAAVGGLVKGLGW